MAQRTVHEWRQELARRLSTINGLTGLAFWPDQIKPPCAIVMPTSGERVTFDDGRLLTFTVTLLAASAQKDNDRSQAALDAYLEEDDAHNVIEALEAEDVAGGGSVTVLRWHSYGRKEVAGGDVPYWGVIFDVAVED